MDQRGLCCCGAVQLAVSGEDHLASFRKTLISERVYCRACGDHPMTRHPTLGLVDVFAAALPGLAFIPRVHVNYAETVLSMKDGLPKFCDFPTEFGGSGELAAGQRAYGVIVT